MGDLLTVGMDVGSSSIKAAALASPDSGPVRVLALRMDRIRRRDPKQVAAECLAALLATVGVREDDVAYLATTGSGEVVARRRGHFYSITTHGRGAIHLVPEAAAALDMGALHAKAMLLDPRGRVVAYRMTSQCASGSGQFLENIGRYLGVGLEEIGQLSRQSKAPESISSICAVLAETDVINMVSRGLKKEDILKGIHLSMAGRFLKLLRAAGVEGTVALTGGLSADAGMQGALQEIAVRDKLSMKLVAPADGLHAGSIGAALCAAMRHHQLEGGARVSTSGLERATA